MRISFSSTLMLCGICILAACNNSNKESSQQGQHKDSAAHTVIVDTLTPRINVFSQRIASNPKDADAYWCRGKLEVVGKKLAPAVSDFMHAVSIDSSKEEYYFNLADASFMMGHTREAKDNFEKCIKLDPKNTDALLKLGEIYYYVKKYSDAISLVDKALKVNPYIGKAYFLKGMIFMETGDTAKAISSMQTSVEQDSRYFDAYVQLGLMFGHKGNIRAVDYFNDAINIQPNNIEPYYDKGLFYQSIGDYDNALKTYNQLLGVDSTYKFAFYNIGVIYYSGNRDYKTALGYFSRAIKQDTSYAMAYYGRASCYKELGQYQYALYDYSHVMYLKPKFQEAKEGYDEVKRKLGK